MSESISVSWYNEEKTIVKQIFHKGWTLAQYWDSVAVAHELIRSQPHTVYTITFVEGGKLVFPDGFITALRQASMQVPDNEGVHVVVGGGFVVNSLYKIGSAFSRENATRVHLVNTVEQAEKIIADAMAKDTKSA